MYTFMAPRMIRNAAEMEVPMMPPTREKESNLPDITDAVPATTTEVMMTMLRIESLD